MARKKQIRSIIYSPAKSSTQSGKGRMGGYVLEIEDGSYKNNDNIMGWTGSDIKRTRIRFSDLKSAEFYAKSRGLDYVVLPNHSASIEPKSYSDNFR